MVIFVGAWSKSLGHPRIGKRSLTGLARFGFEPRAGAILKRFACGYDTAGNRTGELIDLKPGSASYSTANQLTSASGVGQVRFKGSLDKPGTVTVGTNVAMIDHTTNFTGLADVTLGTNVVTVKATDYYAHVRTNQYQLLRTFLTSYFWPIWHRKGFGWLSGLGSYFVAE